MGHFVYFVEMRITRGMITELLGILITPSALLTSQGLKPCLSRAYVKWVKRSTNHVCGYELQWVLRMLWPAQATHFIHEMEELRSYTSLHPSYRLTCPQLLSTLPPTLLIRLPAEDERTDKHAPLFLAQAVSCCVTRADSSP